MQRDGRKKEAKSALKNLFDRFVVIIAGRMARTSSNQILSDFLLQIDKGQPVFIFMILIGRHYLLL